VPLLVQCPREDGAYLPGTTGNDDFHERASATKEWRHTHRSGRDRWRLDKEASGPDCVWAAVVL
jgi:hypothetical protein